MCRSIVAHDGTCVSQILIFSCMFIFFYSDLSKM